MMIPCIDTLESRQHFSVTLTGVELIGPVSRVSSLVLSFNGPLDPTTSQQVKGYALGKPPPGSPDNSFDVGSLFGFRIAGHESPDKAKPIAVKHGKIQFSTAVYDPTADTVTLTAVKPFRAQGYLRVLRVRGTGTYAIKDALGNPFNGGVDDLLSWRLKQGKVIHYIDAEGNHVTIQLKGKGKIFAFMQKSGEPDPIIFIDSTNASSVITGKVLVDNMFSGTTPIAEVNGGQSISNGLLNNSSFNVQATTP